VEKKLPVDMPWPDMVQCRMSILERLYASEERFIVEESTHDLTSSVENRISSGPGLKQ
jgi:hypothetical protein